MENKKKIDISDICGYLPYDLYFMNFGGNIIKCTAEIDYDPYTENNISNILHLQYKPILRPMADINKCIQVEGYNNNRMFNPLIEIAKIIYTSDDIMSCEYQLVNNYKCKIVIYSRDKYVLSISYLICNKGVLITNDNVQMESWNRIFKLLNQWKFDYNNLIINNLAIDINNIPHTYYHCKLAQCIQYGGNTDDVSCANCMSSEIIKF